MKTLWLLYPTNGIEAGKIGIEAGKIFRQERVEFARLLPVGQKNIYRFRGLSRFMQRRSDVVASLTT
ncbi:MAG TPA: hypothetical protein QF499_11135 [Gammaproteobacteria bacterium]|jgi:hypothetical protein|nr:hypothetical protein [Gammaproteobacteria bacterium]MDP7154635.1 hypothetical protein [Gammaproteobacteria bacterium]MDP7297534.1 hypothetical protein [Gammaproteobacteria bacterium]MDP7660537.1 hypothetical protein [Gammaproteobacteria bacterium]HJP39663.1 hypothetical protein [Gammaproteobacteria bacterium]